MVQISSCCAVAPLQPFKLNPNFLETSSSIPNPALQHGVGFDFELMVYIGFRFLFF